MESHNLIAWYLGATLFGAIVAYVTVTIFRRFAPAGSTREYWAVVGKDIHGLLYEDESNFWGHYVNIIRQTGKYVGRQLLALVLAFAPLVVAFYTAGPWMFTLWDRGAEWVVVPEYAGVLSPSPDQVDTAQQDPMSLILPNGAERIDLPPNHSSVALCEPDRFACLVLQGFGFTAITVETTGSPDVGLIVIRTAHDDWNPLWPYLSDPEFLFFLSLSLMSIVFFARKPKSVGTASQDYSISLVDYILTLIATRNMRLMRKLGNLETRLYRKRLADVAINKPVFIAGLARSGTTVLLEKLATGNGVATHRYRDFPFIMMPVIWNKFLRLFGAKQAPSERPHKDKIKITRDSPEAFEEPIWQHFFPNLHDALEPQVLGSEVANREFQTFYQQHIRKILLLRKGSQYVSKGNYNLSRIEYIAQMFPDAVFIIPIRHPFTHVESLVRQHELFKKYSETDPKIPNYLRSVGHYEFGPQRLPINITGSGAKQVNSAWNDGNDLLGYAIQWREVYDYVADLFERNPGLAKRLQVIRFEDLCNEPKLEFERVLKHIGAGSDFSASQLAIGIEASTHRCRLTPELRELCWEIVGSVADSYGYSNTLDDIPAFSGVPSRRGVEH